MPLTHYVTIGHSCLRVLRLDKLTEAHSPFQIVEAERHDIRHASSTTRDGAERGVLEYGDE